MNTAKEHSDKSKAQLEKFQAIQNRHLSELEQFKKEFEAENLITMRTFDFIAFVDGKTEYKPTPDEITSLREVGAGIHHGITRTIEQDINNCRERIRTLTYYIKKAI